MREVDACVMRIQEALAPSLTLNDGTELNMSVTIGAAVYPDHAQNIDELIRSADAAMYTAKTHRRGSFAAFRRNST
jgi:diguanylate cyclase (GGDEF)-like protein